MTKYKLEYIWLDGYTPTPNLRGKTQIKEFASFPTLDQLPLPSQIGATRVGGIDLNKPRIRATLTAVLALSAAPSGFTVADLATRVHTITGNTDYTVRHAAMTCANSGVTDLSSVTDPATPTASP